MYRSLLQKGQSPKILGNPRLGDKQLQQPQSHEAIFRRSAPHLTQQTPTKTMAKKTTMAATQCPRSSQASQAHGSDDALPPLVACCALPPLRTAPACRRRIALLSLQQNEPMHPHPPYTLPWYSPLPPQDSSSPSPTHLINAYYIIQNMGRCCQNSTCQQKLLGFTWYW